MDRQPWAMFAKDSHGKWRFHGFTEFEERASEFEDEHRDDDGNPTGFTVQMPDLDEEKREPMIKWVMPKADPAEWQEGFEKDMDIRFCGLTDHKIEACIIPHRAGLGHTIQEASKYLGEG